MTPEIFTIAATARTTRHTREVYRLTDALMYALKIPQGHQLAPFFAADASDNREAIAAWISKELQHPDIALTSCCIELLLPRLERRLIDITEMAL